MAEKEMAPVWYLAGPFYQYNEDVKALAKAAGLRIIDATVTTGRQHAAETVPEVTLKDGSAPAPARVLTPPEPLPAPVGELIAIAPGVQISPADLEAHAIVTAGITPGKFRQMKKADREALVVGALETLKATEAARNLGK